MAWWNCCCNCGTCPKITEAELPDLVISGMTGEGWVLGGCCWRQQFSYDVEPELEFTDGGQLQLDSSVTTETNRAFLLKKSRPDEYVAGGIQRVDSGGPYPVLAVGPAAWRTDGTNYILVAGTRPACPTCVGPVDCVTETVETTQYEMQRWAIRTRKSGITVYLQNINAICGEDEEPSCKLIMTSATTIQYETIFRFFYRTIIDTAYVDSDCCDGVAPADSTTDSGWPDFDDPDNWSLVDFPSMPSTLRITSAKLLSDLDPQSIEFGPDICADCVLEDSGTAFCDECETGSACLSASGTGEVPAGFCDPKYATHVICTEAFWSFSCGDGSTHTWDDAYVECTTFTPVGVFCDGFTFDLYSFDASVDCADVGSTSFAINYSNMPSFLGITDTSLAPSLPSCYETPTGTCPPVYPVGYEPLVAMVGTMDALTYVATCSGAQDQTVCLGTNWTVDIV
jgi:hypothetical protein